MPSLLFSALFVGWGIYRLNLARNYKKYIECISGGITSAAAISKRTGISFDTVRKQLPWYIKHKWLLNAYYDTATNTVILRRSAAFGAAVAPSGPFEEFGAPTSPKSDIFSPFDILNEAPEPPKPQTTEKNIVHCRGCGAQAVVGRGEIAECEYCGSKIKG